MTITVNVRCDVCKVAGEATAHLRAIEVRTLEGEIVECYVIDHEPTPPGWTREPLDGLHCNQPLCRGSR